MTNFEKAHQRMQIIYKFAADMGYEAVFQTYTHCDNGRPLCCIWLEGTSDKRGVPYNWEWYMDTWEEEIWEEEV
jgi:hypothetical protein